MTFTNIVFTPPGETFSKTASINIDAFPSVEDAIASVVPEGSAWEALSPNQENLPEGFVYDPGLPPELPELTAVDKLAAAGLTVEELKSLLDL